nr:hypothetical protein [Tanacetum cinerariifolium]
MKEADFDLEEEIHLVENLLYDNSSPRPSEKLNVEIADTIVKSLSSSPIPVEDSDSHMEEIDLFLATDDLTPLGIENDDYDSEGDIHFLEELLSNDSIPISENESSNFDHHDDPSFPHPPPEPPDVEVFFEPDSGVLTTKVVKGIFEHYVLMPNILPTLPTFDPLYPLYDTLLPFSSENEDKVFKPGILSYLLVSHRDKITSDFFENLMMMYGGDIPLLDTCGTQSSDVELPRGLTWDLHADVVADVAATWHTLTHPLTGADVAATWTCGTQSSDVALPRGLTWDLHADVVADVAATWHTLTHPLTGGHHR